MTNKGDEHIGLDPFIPDEDEASVCRHQLSGSSEDEREADLRSQHATTVTYRPEGYKGTGATTFTGRSSVLS